MLKITEESQKITREEIITYVDELIQRHKNSYDRRIYPLLYEFFLRSAEKFHWSKEVFLEKYKNFENCTEIIKFAKLPSYTGGRSNKLKKTLYINKKYIKGLKRLNEETYHTFIDTFFHEATHQTDYHVKDGEKAKDGLYEIDSNNNYKNIIKTEEGEVECLDTLLNEYANSVAASVLANHNMYKKDLPIEPNLSGYPSIIIAGSILCAAFDIPEQQMAMLKDKGRETFDGYFKEHYPYIRTNFVIEAFRNNLTLIHKAVQEKDENNILLGHESIMELAFNVLSIRMEEALLHNLSEEFLQRTYFNVTKIGNLILREKEEFSIPEEKMIKQYTMSRTLIDMMYLFRKILRDNGKWESNTVEIMKQWIQNDNIDITNLRKEMLSEHEKPFEFDLEEIVNRYYAEYIKPLNDNTQLIEQLKQNFARPTWKDRIENVFNKSQKPKALPVLDKSIPTQKDCMREFKESLCSNGEDSPISKSDNYRTPKNIEREVGGE